MSSRLVVLGSCGAWPEPGRACSGFLLDRDDFRVVLDLGYATLPRLLAELGSTSARGLDAAIDEVLAWHHLPAPAYDVGPWRLESWPLPHQVPDVGVRLSTDDFVLAYSGDTGPDPQLLDLANGADLLVIEATDRGQQGGASEGRSHSRVHLTARQAGEVAAAAGARRLMLTHFWPGNDREAERAAAREVYEGQVLLAEEGLALDLT